MNLTTMTLILSLTEVSVTDSDPEEETKDEATISTSELPEVPKEAVAEAEGVLKGLMNLTNKMVI